MSVSKFLEDPVSSAALVGTYALVFVLSSVLPGAPTPGYVLTWPALQRSEYRLSGLRVLVLVLALAWALCSHGLADARFFFERYAHCAAAACLLGLAVSAACYVQGRALRAAGAIDRRAWCPTIDDLGKGGRPIAAAAVAQAERATPKGAGKAARRASSAAAAPALVVAPAAAPSSLTAEFDARSEPEHFYCGLGHFNPQWGAVDGKMWLYVVGAVQLQLNLASIVAAHVLGRRALGAAAPPGLALPGGAGSVGFAMLAYGACLSFFVVEYMANEQVHLQTYDIFRERVGLKLVWGCFFFYPFFYAIGGLGLAASPASDISPAAAAGCIALFFLGWTLTRGANMQKAACKGGAADFSWCGVRISMETVPGSGGRVLCGGFWGVSRHVNYLGEILQGVALALPGWLATGSLVPWLYPLYYVALFVPRQVDDDSKCLQKYGRAVWGEYVRRVPSRIVPFVY
jgi:hypothetical protein